MKIDAKAAGACPPDEELKAYVDGELSLLEGARLRRHLAACPRCAEEANAMRILGVEVRKLEGAVEPPAGLRQRVLAQLEFRPERTRRMNRFDMVSWGAAAAIVATVGFVAYGVLAPEGRPARMAAKQMAKNWAGAPGFIPGPSGREAAAKANLKNLGAAAMMYVQDHDEFRTGEEVEAARRRLETHYSKHRNGDPYGYVDGHSKWNQPRTESEASAGGFGGGGMGGGGFALFWPEPKAISPEDVRRYTQGKAIEDVRRKVVQIAELGVRVNRKLEEVQDDVTARVRSYEGYVENADLASPEKGERVTTMSLRVPVECPST